MTDTSGTTVYEYTQKGQVRKETKTIDSIQYVTQYSYDMNGNLKTMTYPSGRVVTYAYDALSRPISATAPVNGTGVTKGVCGDARILRAPPWGAPRLKLRSA